MKNELLFRRALAAAWMVGERIGNDMQSATWTEAQIDAAANELRRRLLADRRTVDV